jgi:hypothetical protein
MPKSTGMGSKHKSRKHLGTSKVVIHYPDMATWRALADQEYTDEEIDEMNPFSITFPSNDMSDDMYSVRKMAAKIVDNNDLIKHRSGSRYDSDKEEFFLFQMKQLVKGLQKHGFRLTSGTQKSETWSREHLSETRKRLAF